MDSFLQLYIYIHVMYLYVSVNDILSWPSRFQTVSLNKGSSLLLSVLRFIVPVGTAGVVKGGWAPQPFPSLSCRGKGVCLTDYLSISHSYAFVYIEIVGYM